MPLLQVSFSFEFFFCSNLTSEQRALTDAVLLFCVKDSDYYGAVHRYNCEAYLGFEELTDITGESGKVQQLRLPLSRPSKTGMLGSLINATHNIHNRLGISSKCNSTKFFLKL